MNITKLSVAEVKGGQKITVKWNKAGFDSLSVTSEDEPRKALSEALQGLVPVVQKVFEWTDEWMKNVTLYSTGAIWQRGEDGDVSHIINFVAR